MYAIKQTNERESMYELLILGRNHRVFTLNATYLMTGKSIIECKEELDRLISKRILNQRSDNIKYLIRKVC